MSGPTPMGIQALFWFLTKGNFSYGIVFYFLVNTLHRKQIKTKPTQTKIRLVWIGLFFCKKKKSKFYKFTFWQKKNQLCKLERTIFPHCQPVLEPPFEWKQKVLLSKGKAFQFNRWALHCVCCFWKTYFNLWFILPHHTCWTSKTASTPVEPQYNRISV